jgi:hypothetical protein
MIDQWKPKQAAMSGHAHGAGRCQAMTAPTIAERDQPPQDGGQERQHGEGDESGRRVEDVADLELVATGELFGVEDEPARQPALRRANVDLAVRAGADPDVHAGREGVPDERAIRDGEQREPNRQRAIPFDEALP